MAPRALTDAEVAARIKDLAGWEVIGASLHRELDLGDFVTAWGFMNQVALLAEKADHHPEWSNVYGRVVIDLTTHETGGLTENDFALAEAIDRILAD